MLRITGKCESAVTKIGRNSKEYEKVIKYKKGLAKVP